MRKVAGKTLKKKEAGGGAQQAAAVPQTEAFRIGAKLRQIRKARRLTLLQLAERIGSSESMISRIETGHVIPSLQLLHRLVSELGTSVAALLSVSFAPDQVVFRKGSRPILDMSSQGVHSGQGVRIESLTMAGELLYASIHSVEPGGLSGGMIAHAGEEAGYVLRGEIELIVDDAKYLLNAGDSFCFRSEREHCYRNRGSTEARILWVNTPTTF